MKLHSKLLSIKGFLALALLFGLVALINPSDAFAATKTWQYGGSNTNWSTAGNWSPSGAPVDGDDIVIVANPGNLTGTNDIASLSVNSITISGSENTALHIDEPLELTGNIINTGNHKYISLSDANSAFILGADIEVRGISFTGDEDSEVNLNGFSLTILDANPSNDHMIFSFDMPIIGTGGLIINAPNTNIQFWEPNTYSGTTELIANSGLLAGSGSGVNITNMFGDSDIVIGLDATVTAALSGVSSGSTWSNNITLLGSTTDVQEWDGMYYTLNFIESPQVTPQLILNVPNITLMGDVRLVAGSSNVLVNLAGITSNGYCMQYGYGGDQAESFQNGAPACLVDDTSSVDDVPGAPSAGGVVKSPVTILIAGMAGVGLLGFGMKKVLALKKVRR